MISFNDKVVLTTNKNFDKIVYEHGVIMDFLFNIIDNAIKKGYMPDYKSDKKFSDISEAFDFYIKQKYYHLPMDIAIKMVYEGKIHRANFQSKPIKFVKKHKEVKTNEFKNHTNNKQTKLEI